MAKSRMLPNKPEYFYLLWQTRFYSQDPFFKGYIPCVKDRSYDSGYRCIIAFKSYIIHRINNDF